MVEIRGVRYADENEAKKTLEELYTSGNFLHLNNWESFVSIYLQAIFHIRNCNKVGENMVPKATRYFNSFHFSVLSSFVSLMF
jgi:hypothetical protein